MERFANIKASINVSEARAQIKDLQKEAQEARDIIRNTSEIMTARSKNLPENETFKKLTEDIKKAEEQYRRLNYELYQLERPKANTDAETLADFRQKCQEAKEELRRLEEERERYNRGELNKRITPEQDETYLKARQTNADATARLGRIENEIRGQQAQIDTYNDANSAMQRLRASVSTTRAEMRAMQDETHKSSSAIKILSTVVKGIGTGFTGAFAFKDLKKGFSDIGKSITGTLGRITARIRRVAVTMAIRRAIRSVVQGLKEGIGYYIGWDKAMNAQVSALKNSLTELKGNLGGAFAPILEIVVPALQQFVGWLTTAVNAVGAFIARLTGKNTYKSVVAGTASEGKQAAQSIGNATDKVRELKKELAHYDELNVISKDDDTSGSGGGSGGGGGSATGTGLQYQDTAIGDSIKDFADKIKEAWAKADFREIGQIVGGKLRDALNSIEWEPIQNACKKVAKSLATFLNGFFETEGLAAALGRTIGEGLNTITGTIHAFLDNLNTDSIGKFLTEGLYTAFKTLDFTTIGQVLSDIPKKIYNFLQGAIEGIPWKEVPSTIIQKIVDFFKGYDFKGIAAAIGGLLGAGLKAAIDLVGSIWDLLQEAWGDLTSYFKKYIEDAGGNIVKGIFNGIVNALKNVGTWIYENLFKPFIDAFKNAFGIHSPSTVMEEQGENIVNGLINGIKALPGKIKEAVIWLWETITGKWGEIAKDLVVNFIAKGQDALKKAGEIWDNLKAGTKKLIAEAKEKVKGALSALKTAWTGIKDKAASLIAEAKEKGLAAISTAWEAITDKGAKLTATAIEGGKKLLGTIADGWESITDKAAELTATVVSKFTGWLGNVFKAGKNVAEHLSFSVIGSVISKFTGWLAKVFKAGKDVAESLTFDIVGSVISKFTGWLAKVFKAGKEVADSLSFDVIGSVIGKFSGWLAKVFKAGKNVAEGLSFGVVASVAGEFLGWLKKIFPLGKSTPNDLNANVILDIVAGWVGTLQEWFNDITGGGKVKADVELQSYDEKNESWIGGKHAEGVNLSPNDGKTERAILDEQGRIIRVEVVPELTEQGRSTLQKQINKNGYTADVTDADTSKVPQRGRTLGHGMLNLEDTDDKTTSEMKMLKGGGVYISDTIDETTKADRTLGGGTLLFGTAVDSIKAGFKRIKDGVLDYVKGDPSGIPAKDKTSKGGQLSYDKGDTSKIPAKDKASKGGGLTFSSADTSKIPAKEKVVHNAKAAIAETDFLKLPLKNRVMDSTTAKITDAKDALDAKKREIKNSKYVANGVSDMLTADKRNIKNSQYVAKTIKDEVPQAKKNVNGMNANLQTFSDKIRSVKNVNDFKALMTTFSDRVSPRTKSMNNFDAKLDSYTDTVSWRRKQMKNFDAAIDSYTDTVSWRKKQMKNFDAAIDSYTDTVNWRRKNMYNFDAHINDYSDDIPWYYKVLKGFQAWISSAVQNSAKGGVFTGGAWLSLPQYASGGRPDHGTVFAAGENGAEIVGTIGGRTEVLNKSQIAMAIYNAVRSAMQGFGMDIVKQIAYDSSVLSAHIDAVATYIPDVNHITQANRIYAKAEGIDYNRLAQALAAQGGDNNTYVFTAQLDGREIFRETVSQNDLYRTQTGRSAFA